MFVSIVWVFVQGNAQSLSLPNSFNIWGQSIVAVGTACHFSLDTFTDIQSYFFPLLFCIVVTATFSIFNGYVIYKWANIDFATSFLGCIPGASASLVAMSEEIGADAIAVAVLQCLRIIMVSLIMPIVASFYITDTNPILIGVLHERDLSTSLPLPINLSILSMVAIIGIKLGKKINFPSNLFLAPFFSSLVFISCFPYQINIPHSIFCGGLLLLGLSIGVRFETKVIKKLAKALLIEIFLVLLLMGICFIAGYEFHVITQIDTMTALLGSTPGALNAMMATVIELGGNSSVVLTMQMSRMLLILTLTPFLSSILLKDSPSSSQSEKII
jgi:membrane AbrB-like protein